MGQTDGRTDGFFWEGGLADHTLETGRPASRQFVDRRKVSAPSPAAGETRKKLPSVEDRGQTDRVTTPTCARVQGGPAKVRQTYIFAGNIILVTLL